MRWRFIILSVYILSLVCMPCTDAKSYDISTVPAIKKQDVSKHLDIDICTPFCICNCCESSILYSFASNNVNIETPLIILQSKAIEYQSVFSCHFFANIWQPPQL